MTQNNIADSNTVDTDTTLYDVAIVGGGINGCGIARDAAMRGLRVYLCEQNDLGSATSANSSKLIHGGLRYLEQYEFGLVRKALLERDVMLNIASHIVWPLTFVLPFAKHLRPKWLIRLGLIFYNILAFPTKLKRASHLAGENNLYLKPLKKAYHYAFTYSDCWVDDHRLVILNALDAQAHGAAICPHTVCHSAEIKKDHWCLTVGTQKGKTRMIRARSLVNATGPWAQQFLISSLQLTSPYALRLVKGSHIIINKPFLHSHAYIFQNSDQRVVFVIPYEDQFTLIGTTDVEYTGDLSTVQCSEDELNYLLNIYNQYFKEKMTKDDTVWAYSGVRPLFEEVGQSASEVTRDYKLELMQDYKAPLLTIWGGKITTYRVLATQAVDQIQSALGMKLSASKTAQNPLPGCDLNFKNLETYQQYLKKKYSWLPDALVTRYARSYGLLAAKFLNSCHCLADLGSYFGASLYQAEVDYLLQHEWAQSCDDILVRRTKLHLHLSVAEKQRLSDYLAADSTAA